MEALLGAGGEEGSVNQGDGIIEYTLLLPAGPSFEDECIALRVLAADVLAWVRERTATYVWDSVPFNLALESPGRGASAVLTGSVRYGDTLQDEWLVLWILRTVSRKYADAGLVIHVAEDAGNPMLIEVAELLPQWLDADVADARTFVFGGQLHCIPHRQHRGVSPEVVLPVVKDVASAARWIREKSKLTALSPAIQAALDAKLSRYPGEAYKNMHTARCSVLELVARVLSANPALVSPAVSAFYERDARQVARANRLPVFMSSSALIEMSVPLTRHLYAKLAQQRFGTPKVYEPLLPPEVRASLASPEGGSTSAVARRHEVGMKLAIGLELLLQGGDGFELIAKVIGGSREAGEGAATTHTDKIRAFLASLRKRGFFEGCRSEADLKAKHAEAMQYYAASTLGSSSASDPGTASWSLQVASALLSDPLCVAALTSGGTQKRKDASDAGVGMAAAPATATSGESGTIGYTWPPRCDVDDDLAWMSIDHGEVELAFKRHEESGNTSGSAGVGAAATKPGEVGELNDLLSSISQFVKQMSGPEGVGDTVQDDDDCLNDVDDNEDGSDSDSSNESESGGEESKDSHVPAPHSGKATGAAHSVPAPANLTAQSSTPPSSDTIAVETTLPPGVPLDVHALLGHVYAIMGCAYPGGEAPSTFTPASTTAAGAQTGTRTRRTVQFDALPPTSSQSDTMNNSEPALGDDSEPSLSSLMSMMDAELEGKQSAASFARLPGDAGTGGDACTPTTTTALSDSDIRYNLVTNLVSSVSSQAGASGPASNIIGNLGFKVPDEWWEAGQASGSEPLHTGQQQPAVAATDSPDETNTSARSDTNTVQLPQAKSVLVAGKVGIALPTPTSSSAAVLAQLRELD